MYNHNKAKTVCIFLGIYCNITIKLYEACFYNCWLYRLIIEVYAILSIFWFNFGSHALDGAARNKQKTHQEKIVWDFCTRPAQKKSEWYQQFHKLNEKKILAHRLSGIHAAVIDAHLASVTRKMCQINLQYLNEGNQTKCPCFISSSEHALYLIKQRAHCICSLTLVGRVQGRVLYVQSPIVRLLMWCLKSEIALNLFFFKIGVNHLKNILGRCLHRKAALKPVRYEADTYYQNVWDVNVRLNVLANLEIIYKGSSLQKQIHYDLGISNHTNIKVLYLSFPQIHWRLKWTVI